MDNREKVIDHLEDCVDYLERNSMRHWVFVKGNVVRVALELLKAQEPKTAKEMLVVGGHLMGKCPRCCKILTAQDHPIACGFCGQAVKWV